MNERIQELAKQAGYNGHYATEEFDVDEFARLLVLECVKFCDEVMKESEIAMEQCKMVKTSDRLMMLHDGTRNGAQMSKNRFKKHFGLEE